MLYDHDYFGDWGSGGDPFETLMLSTGHYMNAYTISTPPHFATNFINLIVERSATNETWVDSQLVPVASFQPIGRSGYYGAQVMVTNGAHTVSSSKPAGVYVYGFAVWDGYGYVGGVGSAKLAAVADAFSVPLNTAVTNDVLANDIFFSRSTVALSIVSNPSHGAAVTNASKNVIYTPQTGYRGNDQFTYQITEGGYLSTATVTMWVGNRPPVAVNDTALVACVGNSVVITVLTNDSDPDGDSLSVLSVGSPTNGTVQINPDNTITYYNNGNMWTAPDDFTYTITDGRGGNATATVHVDVTDSPPPVANEDYAGADCCSGAVVHAGQSTVIPVLCNDYAHVEGRTLTIVSVTQGKSGTIINNGTNVTYTPYPGVSEVGEWFYYTITDGECTATAGVYVPVEP